MADYFVTVGSDPSRDYATVQLAYDDIDTITGSFDLAANGDSVFIEVYDDSVFTDRPTFDGVTSDATNRVTIRQASTGRPTWNLTTGSDHVFTILDDYIVFEGLTIISAADFWNACVRIATWGTQTLGTTFRRCEFDGAGIVYELIQYHQGSVGSAGAPVLFENCVWKDSVAASIRWNADLDIGTQYYTDFTNCTFAGNTGTILQPVLRYTSNGLTMVMKNSMAIEYFTDGDITGEFTGTFTTTGSSNNFYKDDGVNARWPAATLITPTDNPAPGGSDDAIFVDLTTGDLDLVDNADNDVLDQGVGPAADSDIPTEDFYGNARSGTTTDPGYHQASSAGTTHALTPEEVSVTPTLDAPALGQTHSLAPSELSVTPELDSPVLGQEHTLTPEEISTSPSLDGPPIGQSHVLAAAEVTAIPVLDAPALAQSHTLEPSDVVATPLLDSPALGQVHTLAPSDVSAAPTLDSPALSQTHALAGNEVSVVPTLDSPTLGTDDSHSLTAEDLSVAPVLDSPALIQTHALVPDQLAAAPALDPPGLAQTHELAGASLSTPVQLDSPALSQVHTLSGEEVFTTPLLDSPSLSSSGNALTPVNLTVPAPVLDSPSLGQTHALSADEVSTTPVLDSPVLTVVVTGEIQSLSWTHTPADLSWIHEPEALAWTWSEEAPEATSAWDDTFSDTFG